MRKAREKETWKHKEKRDPAPKVSSNNNKRKIYLRNFKRQAEEEKIH